MKNSRKKKLIVLTVTFLFAISLFSGCKKKEADSNSVPEGTETKTQSQTLPPAIDFDISTLITAEKMSGILGEKIKGPEITERGIAANFSSEEGTSIVDIRMEKSTLDNFNKSIESLGDSVKDAPNLGESAKWVADFNQLLVFYKNYNLSIYIEKADRSSDEILLYARDIAAHAIENIK